MRRYTVVLLSLLCAAAVIFVSCRPQEGTDNGQNESISESDITENEGDAFATSEKEITTEMQSGVQQEKAPVDNESLEGEDTALKGEKEESITDYPVMLFMTDGFLYYDTGESSKITPRCGTLDAHFTDFCGQYEIPEKNGTANFKTQDGITGWQNASNITKEVNIGSDWRIFKQLPLASDIVESGFNKCVRREYADGSGYLLFYHDDNSEKGIIPDDHGTEVITVPIKYGSVFDWGISLSSKDISDTGLTLVISQKGGNAKGELQTGSYFGIDSFNGKFWQPVKPVIDNGAWTMVAYLIRNNADTEFRCDWEWLYGKLPKGKYRIHKEIMDFKRAANYDEHSFYLEFEIE